MLKEITFVTQYFAPSWGYGGPPKVLYTFAKELVKLGIKINVITTDVLDEGRNKILYEVLDKIEIFRSRTLSNYAAYKTKLIYAPNILDHSKQIIDKSDLVLFSDIRAIINWQIYPYVIKHKIPYGIFAFGEIPHGYGIKSIIKKLFDEIWVDNFVKNAKWLFVQTEHEKYMYKSVFGIVKERIDLLPLPVENLPNKPSQLLIKEFKNKWDIKSDDKVIIFVGRINVLKGIDILLNSVENLLKKDKRLKLVIVGRDDGYLKTLLSSISPLLKKQIIYIGPLYNKELEIAFSVSACFVITPRIYEETSMASLQALASGLPVVVTKEAEIPYLMDYQAGYIVENNTHKVEEAVKKIIYSSDMGKNFVKSEAIKCIDDHFSAEKVTKQLLQLISK